MKAYAHAALAIFVVVLGVKMYGAKVDNSIQSQITSSRESVLGTSLATAELVDLQMMDSQNVQRNLAELDETGEENLNVKMSQLDQLAIELEQAYLESGDNFEMIAHLKERILSLKEDGEIDFSINNIEEWDIELVYYLIIEERMTLEEINSLNSPTDIDLNEREWQSLLTQSRSDKFKKKILEYKSIETRPGEAALQKHLENLQVENKQEELIEKIWGSEDTRE